MKRFYLIFVTFASAVAQVDYWPLTAGNQWVYWASLGDPLTVEVRGNETVNGRRYAVVHGWQGVREMLLRQEGERLLHYDRQSREERVFVDFGAPVERSFPSSAHPCNTTAAIADHDHAAKLPLGDFAGMTVVRYGGNVCADAGLTQDLFLPYVGLMRRTETSLTGPRSYDLVYARINGVLMVSAPETGFAANVSTGAGNWMVRMTLRGEALRLDFSSGQVFDVNVKNEKGEDVYRWSADKSFIAALQSVDVSGEKNWATMIPAQRTPGRYIVETWLTTIGGTLYRASVEVRVE